MIHKPVARHIFLATIVVCMLTACSQHHTHAPYYNTHATHHVTDGFRNAHIRERMKKRGLMRWLLHQFTAENDSYIPPVISPNLEAIHNPNPNIIQLTWIGHATVLVQHKGINVLTDPIFSKRASFLPFFGPGRSTAPGVAFDDLPDIDIVAISHNHYDHLDYASVKKLAHRKQSRPVVFYVPLGIKAWFKQVNIRADVREHDWWQTDKHTAHEEPICVTATSAQHFSRRGLFDGNRTLWAGWVIEIGHAKIYFAGDTGYMPDFKEIGARFREIDVALVPIGAYAPRELLSHMHITPEEAVRIGHDVRAKYLFPIHWGTFHLTAEPMEEPKIRYVAAANATWQDPDRAFLPPIGETVHADVSDQGRYCDF